MHVQTKTKQAWGDSSWTEGSLLAERYREVRRFTSTLIEPLEAEDCVAQSMPDASPTKWHLGHTTWFFESFVLERFDPDYEPVDPAYAYLFNSYYNALGDRPARPPRGVPTRPTVPQVREYRDLVDASVLRLLDRFQDAERVELVGLLEIGLNHEQQHQELMLADVKHLCSLNSMLPRYRDPLPGEPAAPRALRTPKRGARLDHLSALACTCRGSRIEPAMSTSILTVSTTTAITRALASSTG